jgi:hypothetical protein
MRKLLILSTALAMTLGWLAGARAADPATEAPSVTLSGPHTSGNLSIFLIHGKDALPGKKFLTLQEAMDKKILVVHETKDVNELAVENTSDDTEVFIQAGDIVKGGQQDRVLGYDLIVSAKSGKVPLPSFCVESGRWQKRGGEDAGKFGSSMNYGNGREFRLAVQCAKDQGTVWNKVKEAQDKLEKQVGGSVKSKDSPTSFQLTLEDKKLLENLDKYTKDLGKLLEGKKDVIGYAVVINGKVELADIYASADLFAKVWPRLLKGSAVDALAEFQKDKKFEPATAELVKKFLAEAEKAKKEEKKDVTKRVQVNTRDCEKSLFIQTLDRQNNDAVIRRSYLAK